MPVLGHLVKRVDLEEGGLNGTAWALLICLSIVPAIVLLGATFYLLFLYPYGRNCCCRRAKTKSSQSDTLQQPDNNPDNLWNNYSYTIPQGPTSTSLPKTEAGSSTEFGNSGRLTKSRPRSGQPPHTRMSTQSAQSTNTINMVHEPKPFV